MGRVDDPLEEDKGRYIEMGRKYHELLAPKRRKESTDNNILRVWHDGVLTYYRSKV